MKLLRKVRKRDGTTAELLGRGRRAGVELPHKCSEETLTFRRGGEKVKITKRGGARERFLITTLLKAERTRPRELYQGSPQKKARRRIEKAELSEQKGVDRDKGGKRERRRDK